MKNTIENLTKAFIGESQARNRYTFHAKIAQKEGFEQIAEIFLVTADNEREHAKWLFRLINELKKRSNEDLNEIKVDSEAPTILGNTVDNLKVAIALENYEYNGGSHTMVSLMRPIDEIMKIRLPPPQLTFQPRPAP